MKQTLRGALEALASLKLTVVLFALAMFLIFAGTLAQVNQGIWVVMSQYFRSFMVWIDLQLFLPPQVARVPGSLPFPGGFTLGGLMVLNLVAAHVVRFRPRWNRTGVIALHLGVIVLILGEVTTALFAEEGSMTIDEGSWANFIEDIREAELAVVRAGADGMDHVVAVPQSHLGAGQRVRHEALPFDMRIERWMDNSRVNPLEEGRPGFPANMGAGLRFVAENLPEVSGVEGSAVNAASAYVTLLRDGEELGTWLFSLHLRPQEVLVDDVPYRVALRFKRTYKPYTMHLVEFRHDRFVGTERPRNFSSRVRLVDPTRNEDREVLIYMNHPLRYAGATFYQSAYKEGDTGTILQVVRNPGWLMPYLACALVGVGMTMHFSMHLMGFMRRRSEQKVDG